MPFSVRGSRIISRISIFSSNPLLIRHISSAMPTIIDNADGTVIATAPLIVRLQGANGPNTVGYPPGDVRPEVFDVLGTGPKPQLGDTVRLNRNIYRGLDRWVFTAVLSSAPKPPRPARCPVCGKTVAADHDAVRCEVESYHQPLLEAGIG